jgi:hypothetical protein
MLLLIKSVNVETFWKKFTNGNSNYKKYAVVSYSCIYVELSAEF